MGVMTSSLRVIDVAVTSTSAIVFRCVAVISGMAPLVMPLRLWVVVVLDVDLGMLSVLVVLLVSCIEFQDRGRSHGKGSSSRQFNG